MAHKIAAFGAAIVVVRRPFDEIFRLLVSPTSWRYGVGSETARLAIAQPPETNLGRGAKENHQIE